MTAGKSLSKTVIVVGAGVVGVSCALQVQRRGWSVTLVDPSPAGSGCSFGNAGCIGPQVSVVTPGPTSVRAALPLMFDRESPLSMKWRDIPRYRKWLFAYMDSSREAGIRNYAAAMSKMIGDPVKEWSDLLASANAGHLLKADGWLTVFRSASNLKAAGKYIELRKTLGSQIAMLSGAEVNAAEPMLVGSYAGGYLVENSAHAINPGEVVQALEAEFLRLGGQRLRERVERFVFADGKLCGVQSRAGELRAETIVLSAGVHSPELGVMLGLDLPIVAKRGYHVTMPFLYELRRPLALADEFIHVTPMNNGLRVSGLVEIAPPEQAPNFALAQRMVETASRSIRGVRKNHGTTWMGCRPATPDSLPIVSRVPEHPALILACGHGTVGVATSAATGRLVAEAVDTKPLPKELALARFS